MSEPQPQGKANPPPAQGMRLDWQSMPAEVRGAVEAWLGSPVVAVQSQLTGFSPGVAARLRTADGRGVFVKAASPHPNPGVPAIHRREAQITALLPSTAPVPRLLWQYDDPATGWVVLVFDLIDGHNPAQPWLPAELDRVLDALTALSASLTPSPLPPGTVGTLGEAFQTRLHGWRKFREERPDLIAQLDPWLASHLDRLIQLEADSVAAVAGDTLLNFDVRADNILLTPDQVWFVDWPLACTGAAWADVIFFAPSVTMQGGPSPEQIIARSPTCRDADPAALTAAVAAVAGFFVYNALLPAPPGLPTLRAFQHAQGVVAADWLRLRLAAQ